jgi:hypothetical protein
VDADGPEPPLPFRSLELDDMAVADGTLVAGFLARVEGEDAIAGGRGCGRGEHEQENGGDSDRLTPFTSPVAGGPTILVRERRRSRVAWNTVGQTHYRAFSEWEWV